MAELTTTEAELTTADLARYRISRKRPDEPTLVRGQETETRMTAALRPGSAFSEAEVRSFRSQWNNLQSGFVDEPRQTVEDADKLVGSVIHRLVETLADERSEVAKQWDHCSNVSTENLQMALQCYRSLFDRLLKRKDLRALGCEKEA